MLPLAHDGIEIDQVMVLAMFYRPRNQSQRT